MRADADITEAQLAELVSHFYGKVRTDPELGPVFNGAISDWDTHLEKLTAFWSSVMLGTGRYRGQPMAAHMNLGRAITPALFERWLHLWGEATGEMLPAAPADRLRERAARIGDSLQLGLFYRPGLRRSAEPSRG